jgi:hypothetical protein
MQIIEKVRGVAANFVYVSYKSAQKVDEVRTGID